MKLLRVAFAACVFIASAVAFAQAKVLKKLTLSFEKNGRPTDYILDWTGKDAQDEFGRLLLKASGKNRSVAIQDFFDLGFRPSAETKFYELPGHNVLIIQQHGVGSPGGDTFHAFSSEGRTLYRVQFINKDKAWPFMFTEHYSAGYPYAIRFSPDGATVKTLETLDSQDNPRRLSTFVWDGSAYRQTEAVECKPEECTQLKQWDVFSRGD